MVPSYEYHSQRFQKGESERERAGEFVYKIKRKQLKGGHIVTGACIDEKRKLVERLCLERSQEFANKNSTESTIQLQSLRGCLTVIAYRRWNFRALVVPNGSIKQEKQGLATYIQFPKK